METKPYWRSRRCLIVIMTFFAFVNYFSLNGNIGMAIVEMTSPKQIDLPNGTEYKKPEFDWDSKQRALALGSFAYGQFFVPVAGALATKMGGSTLYSLCVACTAILYLICPYILFVNFYLFILAKAITGTCESFAYVAISQLWSRWIPPDERARCVSVGFLGMNFGYTVTFTTSGWILATWNWKVLFYTTGVIIFLWFLVWITTVSNDPSNDKYISRDELTYIQKKLNTAKQSEKVSYPWKDILLCKPFWMICLFKFSEGCVFIFIMVYLPQYIKDISNTDMKKIGYISAIPQISAIVALLLAGNISDYIRKHEILSVTNIHKLYISIGLFLGAVALVVATLWSNFVVGVICVSVLKFFFLFSMVTVVVNVFDLAPRHASFLQGIASMFSLAGCITTPIFVAFYVTGHDQQQWNVCFLTLGAIFTVTALLNLKYGSGEQQYWANYGLDTTTNDQDCEKRIELLSDVRNIKN